MLYPTIMGVELKIQFRFNRKIKPSSLENSWSKIKNYKHCSKQTGLEQSNFYLLTQARYMAAICLMYATCALRVTSEYLREVIIALHFKTYMEFQGRRSLGFVKSLIR